MRRSTRVSKLRSDEKKKLTKDELSFIHLHESDRRRKIGYKKVRAKLLAMGEGGGDGVKPLVRTSSRVVKKVREAKRWLIEGEEKEDAKEGAKEDAKEDVRLLSRTESDDDTVEVASVVESVDEESFLQRLRNKAHDMYDVVVCDIDTICRYGDCGYVRGDDVLLEMVDFAEGLAVKQQKEALEAANCLNVYDICPETLKPRLLAGFLVKMSAVGRLKSEFDKKMGDMHVRYAGVKRSRTRDEDRKRKC